MGHVTRVGCSSVALVGRGAWFLVLGSGSMVRGAWPMDLLVQLVLGLICE
jgi:hypothetical protein